MRKLFIVLLLLSSQVAFGNTTVNLEYNGDLVTESLEPVIIEGHTMVKLEPLLNLLGYDLHEDTATRGSNTLIFGETIQLNNELLELSIQPQLLNESNYVPLASLLRALGHKVMWDEVTFTVSVEESLDRLHLYYGPSSYSNYKTYDIENVTIDSIGFAWSRIVYEEGKILLNTSSSGGNDMYIPSGHELVMSKPSYLNIFVDGYYDQIFLQSDQLIKQIKSKIEAPSFGQPDFNGVILDFESMALDYQDHYFEFIRILRETLSDETEIYLAIQPFGYNLENIVDTVDGIILMYHDYESKLERIWQLNLDHVHQPISPIKRIEEDLITTLQAFESHDRSKFLLQINLAVVQWQGNESHKRYTPNYNLLLDRLDTLDTDNFYFDENTQNPYVVYTDDDVENTIWYENTGSIQSKIDLIKKYNLGGLSLWHIGNLPEEARPEYQLNIFEEIMKNY